MVRMMCSGGPRAGSGSGKKKNASLMVLSDGGGGAGGAGGSGGSAGGGGGQGVAGCNCARDIAKLRAEMMGGDQKLWVFCTRLLEQNSRMIDQLADFRIETTRSNLESAVALRKLTSNLIFSGATLAVGLFTFMMPYVEGKWQADTVKVVLTEIATLEEKKKKEGNAAVEASVEPASPKDNGTKTVEKKEDPGQALQTGDSAEVPKK